MHLAKETIHEQGIEDFMTSYVTDECTLTLRNAATISSPEQHTNYVNHQIHSHFTLNMKTSVKLKCTLPDSLRYGPVSNFSQSQDHSIRCYVVRTK